MPSIANWNSSPYKSNTPQKCTLRSNSNATAAADSSLSFPFTPRKSPRRCFHSTPSNEIEIDSPKNQLSDKVDWNPRDMEQMSAVKEALHVSTSPSSVVCREDEIKRVLQFCKDCIQHQKSASLYVCGCPGTGKSLSMEKVKLQLFDWANQAGFESPDVLSMNCTSLTNTSEIFTKVIGKYLPRKRATGSVSPLKHLQNLYSQQQHVPGSKMMIIIADELDYLITKDRAVLHDLFMLTTFPYSRCILIGIANAIDLADRFLPRLQSLNCKPMVITFRAYSKDQILRILQERLKALSWTIFHPQALELCARKVAAASGDMRKAMCVCRSAIEFLEAEMKESTSNKDSFVSDEELPNHQTGSVCSIVRIDHMAVALSKAYRSPVVDTIQSLPLHQQIILCSAVRFFRGGKKDATIGELNKSYLDLCKSTMIPPVGILEFLNMCTVLNDQGLLKLGQSRDDKLRRVTLKVDAADITFSLQGVHFFRNCLQ